jgi:hypothetical protein
MKERWYQWLYAHFVAWLARRSWRCCDHSPDVVLCIEGPYPMCPLCIEKVIRSHVEDELRQCCDQLRYERHGGQR